MLLCGIRYSTSSLVRQWGHGQVGWLEVMHRRNVRTALNDALIRLPLLGSHEPAAKVCSPGKGPGLYRGELQGGSGWGTVLDGLDTALDACQGHLPLQSSSGPLTGLSKGDVAGDGPR